MTSTSKYWCALFATIPKIATLAETIETWWSGIDAFLRLHITDARDEDSNRTIKQIKRVGHGFATSQYNVTGVDPPLTTTFHLASSADQEASSRALPVDKAGNIVIPSSGERPSTEHARRRRGLYNPRGVAAADRLCSTLP